MDEQKENTRGDALRKALLYQKKNGYDRLAPGELEAIQDYKAFLNAGKTERECVDRTIAMAEAAGFRPYTRGMALKAGDKVYTANRGKAIMLAVIGKQGLDQGVNIGAAHIDSPRLDLKQNPLYETEELAYLKTHYYGGIRKYQWVHHRRPAAPPGRGAVPQASGRGHPRREPEHSGGQPPPGRRHGQRPGEAGGAGPAEPEVWHCGGGLYLRRAVRRARLLRLRHRL